MLEDALTWAYKTGGMGLLVAVGLLGIVGWFAKSLLTTHQTQTQGVLDSLTDIRTGFAKTADAMGGISRNQEHQTDALKILAEQTGALVRGDHRAEVDRVKHGLQLDRLVDALERKDD